MFCCRYCRIVVSVLIIPGHFVPLLILMLCCYHSWALCFAIVIVLVVIMLLSFLATTSCRCCSCCSYYFLPAQPMLLL